MRMETGNQAIASQQCWGLAGSGRADPSVGAGTLADIRQIRLIHSDPGAKVLLWSRHLKHLGGQVLHFI